MTAMRLDLGRTWADAVAMARMNVDALVAIAGMFMLLPDILVNWMLPTIVLHKGATLQDLLNAYMQVMTGNLPLFILNTVLFSFGSLALLALLIHPERPTVASALRIALYALPFYLLAYIIESFALTAGMLLFVLPAAYLAARFICVPAIVVAEDKRDPFSIIGGSFRLTRGNSLRIAGLLIIIVILWLILSALLTMVTQIVSAFLLSPDLARLLAIVIASVSRGAIGVVYVLISGAIYRQVTAPRPFT